jgi:hypothetical protein
MKDRTRPTWLVTKKKGAVVAYEVAAPMQGTQKERSTSEKHKGEEKTQTEMMRKKKKEKNADMRIEKGEKSEKS